MWLIEKTQTARQLVYSDLQGSRKVVFACALSRYSWLNRLKPLLVCSQQLVCAYLTSGRLQLLSAKRPKPRQVLLSQAVVSSLAMSNTCVYVLHQAAVAVYQVRSLKRLIELSFADGIFSFSLHLGSEFSLIVDKVSLQYPSTDFHCYTVNLRTRKCLLLRSKQLQLRGSIDNSSQH